MGVLVKRVGQRIRYYRMQHKYSQETLAELAGCHSTYIGQIERGEKNATVESIGRIARALQVPMSTLFEKLDEPGVSSNFPLECYELVASKSIPEQEQLYRILL